MAVASANRTEPRPLTPIASAPLKLELTLIPRGSPQEALQDPRDGGGDVILRSSMSLAQSNGAPAGGLQSGTPVPAEDDPEGPVPPVPFDQVVAPPRRSQPANPEGSGELPDLGAVGWQLAPIRWGGNTGSMFNLFRDGEGGRTLTLSETVNLRSASHIYQPWFAQVSGNLGLVMGKTERTGGIGVPETKTGSSSISYGGTLNLFPVSRFPLQVLVDRSDSRVSANATGSDYVSTRFGVRQSYRPEVGAENYSVNYDRSLVQAGATNSQVESLQGNVSIAIDQHSLTGSARYSQSDAGATGESSRLAGISGIHSWRIDEGLNVSSSVNLSGQQIRYNDIGGTASQNDNRLIQATSNFTWLPDEDVPLTVTGGASFLNMGTTTLTGSSDLLNIGGNLGVSYKFSDRLSGTGNAQITGNQSGQTRQTLIVGNGSLSYLGEPLVIGNYNYTWNLGATAGIQGVTGGVTQTSVGGSATHGLSRSIPFSPESVVSINGGQSVSLANNGQAGQGGTLVHSLGASWRVGYEERLTGFFNASLSDNLTTGTYAGHFTTVNLSGNGLLQISRRASATIGSNLVWSSQRQNQAPQQIGAQIFDTGNSQWSGSASLGYQHRNPFDVANLAYSATVQVAGNQTNQRIVGGNPDASIWQTTQSFQQKLDYRIGRLNFQLLNSFGSANGKKNALIFIQINRELGNL